MAGKMAVTCLTEPLFFDTDCISAFLWVDEESILAKMYPRRIVIPLQVYLELSNPRVNYLKGLKNQVDRLVYEGDAKIAEITTGTREFALYLKMTRNPEPGFPYIGKGEAAAISLAKVRGGILASNNLRDISVYVEKYQICHMTTGDILAEAFEHGLITEDQGNTIWLDMLAKKRKLGYPTFSEFLNAGYELAPREADEGER